MSETTTSTDLRERIGDAMHDAAFGAWHESGFDHADCRPCAERLTTLTAIIQPHLDQRDEEIEQLRELTATCVCGTPGLDYDGPDAECPVHGAIRGMREAHAEIDQLKATIARVRRMAQVWIDMRPDYPTATREGHGIAYAGEQIVAVLDQPADSKEG